MDGAGYPSRPEFEAALRQARERAADYTKSKHHNGTPDPPESQATADAKISKDRKLGGGAAAAPRQASTTQSQAGAASSAAPQHPGRLDAASAAAVASSERMLAAERTVGAGGMYHHLPLHGRLGMGLGPGAAGNLLHQLQLSDMHNRYAFEQERAALLAAARGPWRPQHPAAAAAAAAADDQWRAHHGLPPALRPNPLMAGRGLHHPGLHALSPRVPPMASHLPPMGSHLPPIVPGPEMLAPELRPPEFAERAVSYGAPPQEAVEPVETKVAAGASAFDLLAAAAENTLMTEGRHNADDPAEEDAEPLTHPSFNAAAAKRTSKEAAPKTPNKRKRKGANEPKNPLGAFVFYQRKIMAEVFEENPCITFGEAAAECGRRWRLLPSEAKEEFRQLATEDKERYTRELATFKGRNEGEFVVTEPAVIVKIASKRKKQDTEVVVKPRSKTEPRRAKSALLFFKTEEIPRVMKEYPNVTQKEAATEAAARYKALTKAGKEKYEKLAAQDRQRYQREMKENAETEQATNPGPRMPMGEREVDQSTVQFDTNEMPKSDDAKTEREINVWSPGAVFVPAQLTLEAMKDPNPYYVEEQAWRYYNPPIPPAKAPSEGEIVKVPQFAYVSDEDLQPLPPPPPVPADFPNTPFCRWSFDDDSRVLYADFRRDSGDIVVTLEDERFLLEMYERDDITVVSEGLVSGLDKDKWTLDYISRVAGDEYYHRFRRFDKQKVTDVAPKPKKKYKKKSKGTANSSNDTEELAEKVTAILHVEIDNMLSMKVKDFITYLRRRGTALETLNHARPSDEEKAALCTYSFLDHAGVEHTIDVTESALYMLDYDMVKLLPTLYEDFVKSFKLRGCLPGGSNCMMNCVNSNGRPFMGPNMYVTPPGSFTHFHQDGHGTVDSGHYCLSGFNEVVMTRRLTERAKRHALRLLTGSYKHPKSQNFEGLYDLPHADNLGEKPQWPDNEAIDKCNKMNYCVSRFILRGGQCVHINKGRLHAFRKVTNEELPPTDCHAKLRSELLKPGTNEKVVGPGKPEVLCISVAWDWMYRGVTAKGINREIVSILECAALNRKYGAMSLAIPELSLIQMARTLAPKPDEKASPTGAKRESLVGFDYYDGNSLDVPEHGFAPSASVICKGIFPALQYVVKQHIYAINVAESLKSRSFERGKRVSVAERPNAWENPVTHPLDPYGNSDFFCKLCNKELSNVYLHCDGCELLLSKDFNICLECHQEKRYATSVQMHPLNNKRHSTINHIGNFTFDRASRCPCKNGPVCRHCNYCAGCSCRCHSWFTLYFRFFKKDDELKLLHRVKRLVGREELDAAEEAEKRLSMVIKGRYSEGGEGGPFGLHNMDVMVESQFVDAEDVEDFEEEPEGEASSAESDTESVNKESSSQLMRKSSKRPIDEPDSTTEPSEDDADNVIAAEDSAKTFIDRTKKDTMQVGVSDLKVTIRYRSCEWTEQEGDILKQGLEEQSDWQGIFDQFPERSSDQIRKVADANFPKLVEALEKRAAETMDAGPEEIEGKGSAGSEEIEGKGSDPSEPSDRADPAVAEKAKGQVSGEKSDITDEASKSAIVPINGEARQVEKFEEPEDNRALEKTVDKLPPVNNGRWSDDEKERLRVALMNEKDMDGVEHFVGTRRIAAIRSYAPRTFPDLYQEMRDRMHTPDGKKERRRSSKAGKRPVQKPDPDEVIEGEEPGLSTRRRSSRRGSMRKAVAEDIEEEVMKIKEEEEGQDGGEVKVIVKVKEEPKSNDESTEEENEMVPASKPSALNGARKNSTRQTKEGASGRGRRATQDLSGGRKRRNSGPASRSADAAGSSDSSEEAGSPVATRKKRVKVED